MLIFKQKSDISAHLLKLTQKGSSIGFVPTMGALHEGHISLINQCKANAEVSVCSIFVNPTQFNDPADFDKYPVTIESDIYKLETSGCDILFLPTATEIYPNGWESDKLPHFDIGFLGTVFEGEYRPGHFQGVCQVMEQLIHIVQPHFLFMGQKDFQQCMVISRLLEILQSPAKLVVCDTLREPGGLAMSSRNMRLTETQKKSATGIYKALRYIKEHLEVGNNNAVLNSALTILKEHDLKPDYLTLADAKTLAVCQSWDGRTALVALAAAFMGEVRLIDNMVLHPKFARHGN